MRRRILLLVCVCIAIGVAAWGVYRFRALRNDRMVQATTSLVLNTQPSATKWERAVEKIKAERGEAERNGTLVIPSELKHYSERYWFLATQVAEIDKHNVHTCQDYMDLAALLQRGEIVSVSAVTDSYVLYGVGERADDSVFERYYEETQPNGEVTSPPQVHIGDYASLETLAKNFAGRSYDLNNPADREALKINMLRSLRPEALRILEEVSSSYKRQFDRPLHVSSLVRPEQYQRSLNRVNRNAVLIETPPHSTGLAFDIDYRYMGATEQTFVMAELARIKNEGRIEVIRERNANYHVFAFVNGKRPSDELIMASLDRARPPGQEAHHVEKKEPAKAKRGKSVRARKKSVKVPRTRTTRKRRR